MRSLPSRSKDDSTIFDIGVQRIPGLDIETTAQWPGKNYLPLGGNFGLHSKTILPPHEQISVQKPARERGDKETSADDDAPGDRRSHHRPKEYRFLKNAEMLHYLHILHNLLRLWCLELVTVFASRLRGEHIVLVGQAMGMRLSSFVKHKSAAGIAEATRIKTQVL